MDRERVTAGSTGPEPGPAAAKPAPTAAEPSSIAAGPAPPATEPAPPAADRGGRFRPLVAVLLVGGLLGALPVGEPGRRRAGVSPDGAERTGPLYADIQRIDVGEAKARLDAGAARLIDVRDPDDYRAGHIPGAVSVPVDEIGSYRAPDPDEELLTYCA
jgi:hypothetical protein